jgi:hypothetical protein
MSSITPLPKPFYMGTITYHKGAITMPNHCYTNLFVIGLADDVQQFQDAIEPHKAFIPALIPFPENLQGKEIIGNNGVSIGRAYSDSGYQWCLDNWGCKWGDVDTEIDGPMDVTPDGTAQLSVRFWTAWGPAIEGLSAISAMFPRLEFSISYEDECGNFYGYAEFRSGKHGNYSVNSDDPNYPQFTGDDDENSAELVGQCFDHCEAEAFRRLTESQLEMAG